jgi:hypothetical protein
MAVCRDYLHVLSLAVARHRPQTVIVGSWYGSLMILHEEVRSDSADNHDLRHQFDTSAATEGRHVPRAHVGLTDDTECGREVAACLWWR